jgi:predicted esterase YcpF (UPF0227 family)
VNLLYLHGFNSSPASAKARLTAAWLARERPDIRFICPSLSPYPQRAAAAIDAAGEGLDWAETLVLGSSMGGFFATWVAERFPCKAVLINPAVRPWLGREYLLGEQVNHHTGETCVIRQGDIDALAAYGVAAISRPERLWLLLQTGDEVLDYRQAVDFYRGCRITVEPGGDHGFQGFERHLPGIIHFWQAQQ